MPEQTQRLLLIAAAEPVGDGSLLRRAADRLGIGPDAEAPAEDDGLIEFGAQVRFRHPLVRSAAYRAGSVADRRAVHLALAEVTDRDAGSRPARLAPCARGSGPGRHVAADLERSAERAQSRGGVAAAAAFLERAAKLTADPGLRSARALAAARAKFEAAAFDAADALVAAAEIGPLDELQQGQLALLRAQLVYARSRGNDAPPLLLDAAKRLEGLDDRLARETYLEALGAAIFAGRLGTHPTLREVAETARAAHRPRPRLHAPSTCCWTASRSRFTDGYSAAAPLMRNALELFRRHAENGDAGNMRWFWLAWTLAGELWDDVLVEELATRAVRLARDAGALGHLPIALACRAGVHVTAGEFTAAAALIEESDSISAATGYAPLAYASGRLVAWRGDRGEARGTTSGGRWRTRRCGARDGRSVNPATCRLSCTTDSAGTTRRWSAPALRASTMSSASAVSPSSNSSRLPCAEPHLSRRRGAAGSRGTNAAGGHRLGARHPGSLTRPARLRRRADALYLEAIERLGRSRIVVHLARAHLVYGEWLRRENRRLDAREQLRLAHDMFHGMGAEAFAERARRELLATGATARERTVTTAGRPHPAGSPDRPVGGGRAGRTRRSAASCSSAPGRSSTT